MNSFSVAPQNSWFYSLWKFSRPHTIIGTSLSVLAIYLIALNSYYLNSTIHNFLYFLGAWAACICGNIYIVGLNQLEDVAIDKINKPHLPLASGEFSLTQGKWIVGITGILGLIVSAYLGKWLLATVAISLAIGSAYSLPPIRLKRFPLLAALCILSVRGVIVNLGIFLYFSQKLGEKEFLPGSLWALTLFILVFTVAIAIFKDVPDMEGDKQYNIKTFSLLLGKGTILNITRWLISICYLGMIIAGVFWLADVNKWFLIISHIVLIIVLWWRASGVVLEEKKAIASFYQFIWKLFFLEYILFPVACLITKL